MKTPPMFMAMPWMPVGRPNLNSERMIVQSGPHGPPRGNDTTHPPRTSFVTAYAETMPDARHRPMAEPMVPNAGMGPRPPISTTLNAMLSRVSAMPMRIGVRASPAARRAPPSMKNTRNPPLKMNITRRNGRASAFTAGAALTKSSRTGDRR